MRYRNFYDQNKSVERNFCALVVYGVEELFILPLRLILAVLPRDLVRAFLGIVLRLVRLV